MLTYNKIISLRLRTKELTLLKQVCEARGENPSVFVRRSMRRELARLSYLTPEEKKALQVPTVEEVKNR